MPAAASRSAGRCPVGDRQPVEDGDEQQPAHVDLGERERRGDAAEDGERRPRPTRVRERGDHGRREQERHERARMHRLVGQRLQHLERAQDRGQREHETAVSSRTATPVSAAVASQMTRTTSRPESSVSGRWRIANGPPRTSSQNGPYWL